MTQTFSKSLTRLLFVFVVALAVCCFGDGLIYFFIAEPFVLNTSVIVGFNGERVIRFKGKAANIYAYVTGEFQRPDPGGYTGRAYHEFLTYYRDEDHLNDNVYSAFVFSLFHSFLPILFFLSSTGNPSSRIVTVTMFSHRSKRSIQTGTSPVSD